MERKGGFVLIALASMLWSTDALVRSPAVNQLRAEWIVFIEHAIALLCLLPFALMSQGRDLLRLDRRELAAAAFTGIGGSAIATLLFTASFRYINPSVAILLQKTQPIFVLLLARALLRERPGPGFAWWSTIALLAAVTLSVPDLGAAFRSIGSFDEVRGQAYALTAAILWAAATVFGKRLTRNAGSLKVSTWRFWFGLVALGAIVAYETWSGHPPSAEPLEASTSLQLSLLYMALFPGLSAMLLYYAGLKRTPALVATFAELFFPVGAVILNWLFLDSKLTPVQIVSALVLLFAVTRIRAESSPDPDPRKA